MKIVFWEIILIIATVPVFRAIWLLLDSHDWFFEPAGLVLSLIVGLALSIFAFIMIHRRK